MASNDTREEIRDFFLRRHTRKMQENAKLIVDTMGDSFEDMDEDDRVALQDMLDGKVSEDELSKFDEKFSRDYSEILNTLELVGHALSVGGAIVRSDAFAAWMKTQAQAMSNYVMELQEAGFLRSEAITIAAQSGFNQPESFSVGLSSHDYEDPSSPEY